MKPPIPISELPLAAATIETVSLAKSPSGSCNWSAVGASFVCPGAGQFVCGHRAAGMLFLVGFLVACLVGLLPLGMVLLQQVRVAMGAPDAVAQGIPWIAIGSGLLLAIIVWIVAMIHAAGLASAADDE